MFHIDKTCNRSIVFLPLCTVTFKTLLDNLTDNSKGNGKLSKLYAKITGDPKLMQPDVSVAPAARSWSNSYDEDCAILGLVPKVGEEELHRRCSSMDAQIQYFNKLKMLVQVEYEFLREKRRLRREYKRMNEMRSSGISRRYYRCSSRQRSRSKSRHTSRSYRRESRYRDATNNIWTPTISKNSNQSNHSSFAASNQLSFGMVFHQSQNHCTSENYFDNTTSGCHIDINMNSEINYKINSNNLKPKVYKMKFVKSEATKCILKELDSMLDKICYEKNINILQKGVNLDIIRKSKDVVKRRLDGLNITNDMACDAIVSCYRQIFSKYDDRKLIEAFLNEYVIANPQLQNKSEGTSVSSTESYFNNCDDEDNNMWREIEEILQDVKIEPLSADGEEDDSIKNNSSKLEKIDEPKITEEIDLTHEPILVSENNTQHEMIVMMVNNSREIVDTDKNKQVIYQKEISTDFSQQSFVNRKPTFFIATKSLMRKMKSEITEISPIDVKKFTDIVKKDIRNKLLILLKGREYMKTANIVKLFREHYPKENYKHFLKCVAENLKSGKI